MSNRKRSASEMSETQEMSIYEKKFAKSEDTDAILVVEGKKLHVNKAFLSIQSPFFNTLFNSDFKEKSMDEIPIQDVKFEDFAILLSLVHAHKGPILPEETDIEKILELADRFMLPGAKPSLELELCISNKKCLCVTNNDERLDKIRIADKFQLETLLNQQLTIFDPHSHYQRFSSSPIINEMSDSTKVKLFKRILEIHGY